MANLLEVRDLRVSFGAHEAVRGLSFDIAHGETLALVGESGCGKSATALSLMRLVPTPGRVTGSLRFDGRELLDLPAREIREIRGQQISMIFQEPMTSLNPVLSIGAQIVETLRQHERLSKAAAWKRAVELLELVRIPEPQRRVFDFPHELSGGQRQRVMIAMAVACRPRLLIADEPTTALDVTIQARILDLLDGLRRELSMSLLLITHDLGIVASHADRVAVMLAGEKVEEAPVARLFTQAQHAYTRGLLGASLNLADDLHYRGWKLPEIRHGIDDDGKPSFAVVARSVRTGHFVADADPAQRLTAVSEAPLLALQDVRIDYPQRHGKTTLRAVDGVSLQIARGETVGLVGESGCGKSTLSKAILRLVPTAGGEIRLRGTDLVPLGERELRPLRRHVQMVFQDPYASLNPRRTVAEILDTVLVVNGIGNAQQRRARIATMLDRVGLPNSALGRFPHEFSGGQRQRIGIARALVLEPDLLICDEPVSALDVSIQAQILNLLVDLKRDLGLAYLFISHDLSVVRYIADRVHVMQAGRIVESGHHRDIWRAPQHPYTRTLLDAIPGKTFDAQAA
ncbi:ABC transporter ATP-binding protein [Paraburkholderia fungorum]|uniref:ABC transporter ATP-binding protein n=1 Tax=Paraburkholderia fungorum TaxID=134537 RepID=UPI00048217D2|nr:ABC transporter ATP-binding protein [Paraburkholderia fungorum]KFX61793.1 glutathione ABC transporter ATP-binding protein [Burkholderia sp. K24]MBB5545786.1 peptide/nickel transport system ATP-binding protein [Paraburkholderia fungorum]PNE55779.1 ABC transporter ATP-binding protein [Paraburkholderia fungorum]USX10101.1 ABC transporter ATP-binding protein [Paraburkholderia fungorum]